ARQFGKGGGPVHVAVAQQDDLRVDSLRKERFCEGFVHFGHGRATTWICEVNRYATSISGDAQSIQLKRPTQKHASANEGDAIGLGDMAVLQCFQNNRTRLSSACAKFLREVGQ